IFGATSASYTIASAAAGNAGTYRVVATNSAGTVTSSGAVLTVTAAPVITTQPVSQTVGAGSSVTFTVVANGTPAPTYQWQKNGANISGATSASYTIASVEMRNAGTYRVVAINSVGSVKSSGAVLTVTRATKRGAVTAVSSSTSQDGGTVMTTPMTVSTLAGQALIYGSADGTGSSANFYYPSGVATDNAGNLYIADTDNHTIREVVAATGAVTTLAGLAGVSGSDDGTGSDARFDSPSGVAVDGAGNLYVADTNNHTIRKVVLATGEVTTIAGLAGNSGSADGMGSAAQFDYPSGVAVDTAGNIYVADTDNGTIRQILPSGSVSTLAGLAGNFGSADGAGSAAQFDSPSAVAVDLSGNVYVADTDNFTIRMVVPATGA